MEDLVEKGIPLVNTSGYCEAGVPVVAFSRAKVIESMVLHLDELEPRELVFVYDAAPDSEQAGMGSRFVELARKQGLVAGACSIGAPPTQWKDHEQELTPAMEGELRELISSLDFPVGIACMCGFDQQSTFTKFFRRETGMTPPTCTASNKELNSHMRQPPLCFNEQRLSQKIRAND